MGTTNLGNQYITFRYRHPAKAQDFNTLLRGGIQAGIYEGANVTIESANTISISPFIAYINVGNDKTIRIQTFLPITLTVNESTPVIYLMYEWQNVINNYVDVLQRAHGSQPIENEVCVCECIFTNGSITGIDYSVRNYGKQIQIPIDENLPPIITNSQIKVNNLNADLLDGKHAGNNDGDISINNGTLNNNLNADMFDGYHIDEFMLQHEGSYSEYYVQDTAPTTNHGTLWYNTTNNKLYKYNNILSKWIEINWQEIIKATPEWQAGKLRISNGMLQIADGQATPIWHDCYPLVGADVCYIKDLTKYYYLHKACIGYGSRFPITFCSALRTTYITYSYPQSMFVNVSGQSCSSNTYYHYNREVSGHQGGKATYNHAIMSYTCFFSHVNIYYTTIYSTSIGWYTHATDYGVYHAASKTSLLSSYYYFGTQYHGENTYFYIEKKGVIL